MSAPESPPLTENLDAAPQRPDHIAKPFYDFLLGRELGREEIFDKYCIISGDVRAISGRVEEYIEQNEGTPVKILTLMYGERVPDDYMIACDPASEILIVVQAERD